MTAWCSLSQDMQQGPFVICLGWHVTPLLLELTLFCAYCPSSAHLQKSRQGWGYQSSICRCVMGHYMSTLHHTVHVTERVCSSLEDHSCAVNSSNFFCMYGNADIVCLRRSTSGMVEACPFNCTGWKEASDTAQFTRLVAGGPEWLSSHRKVSKLVPVYLHFEINLKYKVTAMLG